MRRYDAIKSDIFSSAVTLFVMSSKFSPFRRAAPDDPYYKRLESKDKTKFWKIFAQYKTTSALKDLFEKMS